jgi:PAS domain S-box-containing protein
MKARLRASETQYRKIVETAQEGIWLLDGEGRTTYANQRLASLLDSSPEELAGLPFGGFVDEESREASARLLAALARGEEVREELSFIRRDGERFWASVAASPILDDDGRTSRLLAMVTDLSEQRRLLAQVMASDRLASVGVLAAGVAHDLKNALAGVLANLELAGRDAESVAGAREAPATLSRLQAEIADAREGAERVHEIARDLNLLAGPAEDRTSLVDLRRPLESASRICGARIRERARLEKRFADIPLVRADESKLVQVFLNLLVNASQALPMSPGPNARIEISTRVDESGDVVAEVLDSGSGMSRETLERLFTPFFTTKPHGEGTGLGLSICRRIVESFGGTIVVESELRRGSRFSIRFPPAADQVAPAAEAPPASVATMRRATILLVDDDETVRSVIARILEQHHQLTACGSAEAALEALGGLPHVDLILSDVQMPGLSGLQFYEELRRRSPDLAERVVFLTGGAVGSRAEEFLATVPNTRLEKPFRVSELLEQIARALARFESSESVG